MNEAIRSSEEIFHKAISMDPRLRAAYLRYACEGNSVLFVEVEALIAAHESSQSFLARPAFESGSEFNPKRSQASMPRQIGRYRIHSLISSGGMGIVYRGEQESPRRAVAVKVIRPGFAPVEALRRFEREAELLGRLHHPGIAQIFEAGKAETEAGPQPFFAMELIQGISLTDFARRRCLATRDRLKLLIQVCHAVHHAHQMGVIHRDLKPANILVDRHGQAKVLDFGLARVVGITGKAGSLQTMSGQLLGTMPYMSPEQVSGNGDDTDARSDVYALGVIGFELLTGRLPYELGGATIPQAARIIAEAAPLTLSRFDRSLRGDLETIFAKTLEKERSQRYVSARDLASDLERFLADEPIAARPASAAYQMSRFARKNKALVAGVLGVMLALAGGLATTMAQAERARSSEAVAKAAQAQAQELAERAKRSEAAAKASETAALAAEEKAKESQAEAEKLAAREHDLRRQSEREQARLQIALAMNLGHVGHFRSLTVASGPGRGRRETTSEETKELLWGQDVLKDISEAVEAGPSRKEAENIRALEIISQKIQREASRYPKSAQEMRLMLDRARVALGLD